MESKFQTYGNWLASIDFETLGLIPGYHEVIQVGCIMLDDNLEEIGTAFKRYIKPVHPERADPEAFAVCGISVEMLEFEHDAAQVADEFTQWVRSYEIPINRCLIPLAHNWPFEDAHSLYWLGWQQKYTLFHGHYRCTMGMANQINDRYVFAGKAPPFKEVNLVALCKHFDIINLKAHDALEDCRVTPKVYKKLLEYPLP